MNIHGGTYVENVGFRASGTAGAPRVDLGGKIRRAPPDLGAYER